MLDRIAEWASSDAMSLPVPAVVAGLGVIIAALALMRARFEGAGAPFLQGALVVTAVLAGWWTLDHFARRDLAAEQRAVEARAHDLATRALAPGSALACLDAVAGDAVEDACEKAVFATPEATAAAVAYVAEQLSLLASAGEQARRARPSSGASARVAQLRRAIEADRFGIAAHVLSVRDGCIPDRCAAFDLLQDTTRLSANLAEHPFDARVKRHAAGWPAADARPVASNLPPAALAPAPAPRSPNGLYFPSASSIPPVNIMTAEPATRPQDTTGAAEAGTSSPRKTAPNAAQSRSQASSGSAPAARPAPMPLAPAQ
ncbi:MAG TPA: hypothetical protein VH397_21300 [Xanthobacteraceae bacterium]|jgi:hypothetical protein